MRELEPHIPPELEELRIIVGDEAMEMVSALFLATIVFLMASHSLAKTRPHDKAQKRKWESEVRHAEKCYLKARARLKEFYIPPSAQEVIDEFCSVT